MAQRYNNGRKRDKSAKIWMRGELLLEFDLAADEFRYSRDGAFEEAASDFITKHKGTCEAMKGIEQ